MLTPQACVTTSMSERGAIYCVQSAGEILDKIDVSRPTEFVHLTGVYFEGGEFDFHVRAVDVRSVIALGEDRFQFELSEYMGEREAREADRAMRHNTAVAQALMLKSEINDEDEEEGES